MMQPDGQAMVQRPNSPQQAFLEQLEARVGARSFDHWFRDKVVVNVEADELTLGVGSPFLLNWMQRHFRQAVSAAAQAVLGPSARVRFQVDSRVSLQREDHEKTRHVRAVAPQIEKGGLSDDTRNGAKQQQGTGQSASRGDAQKASSKRDAPPHAASRGRRFSDLAEFVAGPGNELPLTAVQQVCEFPGERLNPLYLHGKVGTGKTHLLEGIYRRIRREFPSLKVMFLTSEAFGNYFTQAIARKTMPSFRQKFRNLDVLLVDDVDFLDGKQRMQEEFLNTFNELDSCGRQIVLTGDRHPQLFAELSDDLTTRFLSGLVCRLEAPDYETRLRILERKAGTMNARLTSGALEYVARRFKHNVRELEGALNCLATYHAMTGKPVGVTAAQSVLADLERDCVRTIRMSDIERTVCGFFGVEPQALKSSRRSRSISQPRMLAMFLARKYTQAAYSEIGDYFGGRNHSTVIAAEKRVQGWLSAETPIRVFSRDWSTEELLGVLEQQLQAG